MKIYQLSIILSLLLNIQALAVNQVRINIYNPYEIKAIVFSTLEGKYQIISEEGTVYRIKKNNAIHITAVGNYLHIWDLDELIGKFKKIKIIHTSKESLCKLETTTPHIKPRFYNGDFELTAKSNLLRIKNFTDINTYLAGVVEAEAGPSAPYEFYKSQAIISRTYFLSILNKKGEEHYWLGDDVNHQVYKGVSHKNHQIIQAVKHTAGLVIIDTSENLITAAFHSNSGGQTINSEDVWLSSTSYLKGTADPYSLNQRNSEWADTIPVQDWFDFLSKYGIDTIPNDALNFNPEKRAIYYQLNSDTISLRKIREHFKLRSTWFSIEYKNDSIVMNGRGYGHGVGLSQEGAMEMARQNYSFIDIIHFYYKNVKVINYKLLFGNL